MSHEPQPIETAPREGGWVLGLVLPGGPTDTHWQPWIPITWGDNGWVDDDYNRQSPTAWVPLPDPQPRPTGWTPPAGTIKVQEITGEGWTSNGKPIAVPYRWQVYVELPDGSMDEYREWYPCATRQEADRHAMKWVESLGLPVVVVPLPPQPSNVIAFRPALSEDSEVGGRA